VFEQLLSYSSNGSLFFELAIAVLASLIVAGVVYRRIYVQQLRLNTAIENMSQGLTMFDRFERLVLCNQRYLEMYGLSPKIIKPGCSVADVVRHRIETGSLTTDEANAYADRRRETLSHGTVTGNIFTLPNGREIQVTRHPMPGGGWVTTHEDVTERRRAEAKIAYMAHHDTLTGLANRVLLRERLQAVVPRIARGEQTAVLYLDLDRFKNINDSLGHAVGDMLLKSVADRLRLCVRETDTVARLGGDEFAILQTAIERPTSADRLAQRIRDAVKIPYIINEQQILIDVSIGISLAPNDGADPDQLIKQADMAMYAAKYDGRGRFRYFEAEMNTRANARRKTELDLRHAIVNKEFELCYQPLVNLERNDICSCEALVRWRHPERGLISPAEFIPVAEEAGLISQIGEWVLKTACMEAATWPKGITVAVNVSPSQFKDKTLILHVMTALAASQLPARRLAIEITENVLMTDNEANLAILHQLRDLGVQIVMDDFGTGYSSLSYLRSFPFDKIKIDRSFIDDRSGKGNADAIIQATTSMAKSLNIKTTAEGVETKEQMVKIRDLGCTEMQGYLISRPLRAADITALLVSGVKRQVSAA
jgi:diguanylate cyclase (GGDEF)-like protein